MSNPIYLYAIVWQRPGFLEGLGSLAGLDDAALEGLCEGGLLAICSSVPAAGWEPEALDEHVRDMEWLAPRATRHQAVLAALHVASPSLLPLPFATLYYHRDAVHELLRSRQDELTAALRRLEGAEEWTLRVYQDRGIFDQQVEHLSPTFAQATEELRTAAPGKAYLLRKQLDTLRRDEVTRVTSRQADELEQQIAPLARETIREPIVEPTRSGPGTRGAAADARLVLKLALLLQRTSGDALQARLGAIADDYASLGYRFELTGPWPPYSFATVHPRGDA